MTDKLVEMLNETFTRGCSFKAQRMARLTDEQNAALDYALRNPAKSVRSIVDALTSTGFATSKDTITKHRKGMCLECQTN